MGFHEVIFRAWRENHLFSVLVELTYRCNLDCVFCYNDLRRTGTPLSTGQYLRFFEDLRDLHVMDLTLSGGEPLAHPDFFVLGRKTRELGFLTRIKSNGHALRGTLARRVKREIDPFVIDLSLHGARGSTHDRQTRVAGSFDRLLSNIPELLEIGLRLKLNCTMTRWNAGEVEGMYEIADSFGIPMTINPTVSPRDDGDREPLSLSASREDKLRLFRTLAARAGARQKTEDLSSPRGADEAMGPVSAEKNCGAGSSHVTIDPYGDVLPCVQWRRPVGNLHEQSIQEIWARSTGLAEVRNVTLEAKKMVAGLGSRGRLMGFCPGLADLASGNPLAAYASGSEQMELLEQLELERESGKAALPVLS